MCDIDFWFHFKAVQINKCFFFRKKKKKTINDVVFGTVSVLNDIVQVKINKLKGRRFRSQWAFNCPFCF